MEQSYKEKYEQAIERLKQWDREHPCAGYVLSDRDKFIFPELAESEQKPNGGIVREDFTQGDGWYKVNLDYLSKAQVEEIEQLVEKWNPKEVSEEEKIKKAILIYLDWLDGKKDYLPKGDYTIKDMILWLEKQGEKKSITFNNGHLIDSALNDYCCKQYNALHKENGGVLSFARLQHLAMDIYGWCKEYLQGEQKPADKVEPKFKVGDKIYLKPEYRMPNDDTPIANTVKEIRRIDDKHYRFDGSYIFIEDQDKYAIAEQKPAELAKGEDYGIDGLWHAQRILEKTFGKVDGYKTDDGILSHECAISAVKELYEQKPACGEEDSFRTETLISVIKSGGSIRPELRNEFVNWLKSLRPQNRWKPSELQLGCLSDAIEHYNSLGYPAPKLKELLDDLKKLKEGNV